MASCTFDPAQAARFARMALDCVHREYPGKISHSLNSEADVKPPRELTPAFYGCFDWHSSVHNHWLLAKLARLFPGAPFAADARLALAQSLTATHVAQEVQYLSGDGRSSFERPYGLAWLLQLGTELREWDDDDARQWSAALRPLEETAVARIASWLPKLHRPIRSGEHNNTAFSMGLMLDFARVAGDTDFSRLLGSRAWDYYLQDRDCPLGWEPSGEDFLSPCLAEADLMRRLLPQPEFVRWFGAFLPGVDLQPTRPADVTDGKLYHLAGLNLSRAWMLEGIVSRLPTEDVRRQHLSTLALGLREAGLGSIDGEHYEGAHWLGTFAVYLLSCRGIAPETS